MEGVVQRGTAQKLKVLNRPIAGKTGTTNDEKDGWFIGFTPDLVVGAYFGFDSPRRWDMARPAAILAAPVVRDFVKVALADQPPVPFRAPPGIKLVRVNLKTGLPAGPGDKTAIMEAFKPSEEPPSSIPRPRRGAWRNLGGFDPLPGRPSRRAGRGPMPDLARPAAAASGEPRRRLPGAPVMTAL